MTRHHMGETEDAVESGVVSGLAGLTIGFAAKKTGLSESSAPFVLMGLGVLANGAAIASPLKANGRDRARKAGDIAIGIGFSKLGERFASISVPGTHHGELNGGGSSSFGFDGMLKAAEKL
jgi:hypothetical protein